MDEVHHANEVGAILELVALVDVFAFVFSWVCE